MGRRGFEAARWWHELKGFGSIPGLWRLEISGPRLGGCFLKALEAGITTSAILPDQAKAPVM